MGTNINVHMQQSGHYPHKKLDVRYINEELDYKVLSYLIRLDNYIYNNSIGFGWFETQVIQYIDHYIGCSFCFVVGDGYFKNKNTFNALNIILFNKTNNIKEFNKINNLLNKKYIEIIKNK